MAEPVRRRRKAVDVVTMQWTGDNVSDLVDFTSGHFFPAGCGGFLTPDITAEVYDRLHDTWVGVKTGQHIVHGTMDEFYPIAEDVLDATYELAGVEARRPRTRWHVEVREHDGWVPATTPMESRDRVAEVLAERRARHTDREFRMVRGVTTYTVEEQQEADRADA